MSYQKSTLTNSGSVHVLALAEIYGVTPPTMARIVGVSRQALLKTPQSERLQPKLRFLEQLFIRAKNLTGSD